jgi:putative FmdB family regulatory protein
MPIYEYRCSKCGQVFEKMVRFSEADHNPICPNCESQNTERKISTIAAVGASSSAASTSSSSCGSNEGFR